VLTLALGADVAAEGSIASETLLKVFCSCEPRLVTTAAIAPAMPAAMRAYSMAVAPGSSFRKNRIGLAMFEMIERPQQIESPGATGRVEPGFIASN